MPVENDLHLNDLDYSDDELENSDEDFGIEDDFEFNTKQPLYCLPLYSQLAKHKQSLVFKDPPAGCRLCVIATNVAETSLTIPNIKYVVDTGKVKNKVYDNVTGISTFIVQWTSKASADQRAGRAGRTSAGHCYRLYSSAVFNDEFKKYSEPEIVSKPIDDFLLQMKAIGITNIMNYPFPTAPNIESLMAAENRLVMLSALKKSTVCGKNGKPVTVTEVTPLGKTLSYFPTSPRYSKILAQAHISKIIPHAVAIIAGLTVQEIFSNQENCKRVDRKLFYSNPYTLVLGDLMVLLVAIATSNEEGLSAMFCDKVGLRYNAMEEINKLRSQLLHYVNKIYGANYTMDIPLPTEKQIKLLRLTFLCGFGDHVAKRVPFEYDGDDPEAAKRRPLRNCYQSIEVEKQVFISPQSALYNETPEYVVYQEIYESSEHSQSGRLYMRNIFVIDCEWLPKCVKELCNLSNPLEEPPPRFDHKSGKVKCHCASTFGPYNWKISPVEVEYPDGSDKYRHFAYHLLNGDIIKSLSQHCGHLLMQPKMFVKPWAYIKPQVDKVVKCLANNEISTRQALIDKWKTDSKFLLAEYQLWFEANYASVIKSKWPPN